MTSEESQDRASSQSQKSLDIDIKTGNQVGWSPRKTSHQEAEDVEDVSGAGHGVTVATEGVSGGSRQKTYSIHSVETMEGLPCRAAPESLHPMGTGHTNGPQIALAKYESHPCHQHHRRHGEQQ